MSEAENMNAYICYRIEKSDETNSQTIVIRQ
jgi:hypothetical protein